MDDDPEVLAACPPAAFPAVEKVLGSYVHLVPVNSLEAAEAMLFSNRRIRLILCGVHFDESRMHDLLSYAHREFPRTPFICMRVLEAEIPHISVQALSSAAKTLGAVAFIDMPGISSRFGQEAADREFRNAVLAHLPGREL